MGASVKANSYTFSLAPFTGTNSDTANWSWATPTPADTISWNSGANEADGASFPRTAPQVTEMKFFVPGSSVIMLHPFTGFARSDTGALGSTAICSGRGGSTIYAGFFRAQAYRASWTVTATGTIAFGVAGTSYEAKADADDPITVTRDHLAAAGITGQRFNLYLPVALEDMAHGKNGAGGLTVSFETDSGSADLIRLRSDENGVVVSGDDPDFLTVFRLRDALENPMSRAEQPWRLHSIRDSIASLMRHETLADPFRMGFLLRDIPIPTADIGPNGTFAQFHVKTETAENGFGEGREKQRRYEQLG